jgi:protein-S-isoprenylcysteine O-methyltransferase Ste14
MSHRIPPPLAFAIAAIAMWLIGRNVEAGHFSFPYQTMVGILIIALGLGIVIVSLRLFFVAGTTPNPMQPKQATELVTSGIYSISRNPMYLGDAIMLAGLLVWTASALNVVPLIAFLIYIDRFQIVAEEKALTANFGERYVAYRRRVRRWL